MPGLHVRNIMLLVGLLSVDGMVVCYGIKKIDRVGRDGEKIA